MQTSDSSIIGVFGILMRTAAAAVRSEKPFNLFPIFAEQLSKLEL